MRSILQTGRSRRQIYHTGRRACGPCGYSPACELDQSEGDGQEYCTLAEENRRTQRQRRRGISRCSGRCGIIRLSTSRSWWCSCRASNQATMTTVRSLLQPNLTNVEDDVSTTLQDSGRELQAEFAKYSSKFTQPHPELSYWSGRFRHSSRSWVLSRNRSSRRTLRVQFKDISARPEQTLRKASRKCRPAKFSKLHSSSSLPPPRSTRVQAAQESVSSSVISPTIGGTSSTDARHLTHCCCHSGFSSPDLLFPVLHTILT